MYRLQIMLTLQVLALSGCGSERTYSGIWQEAECADTNEDNCPALLHELHLGRYGRALTGIIVPYKRQPRLDSFQRVYACDCLFIQGGRSQEQTITFGAYQPDERCEGEASGSMDEPCTHCQCPDMRYELSEDGDDLIGTIYCGVTKHRDVRFKQVPGRSRRQCNDILELQ